VYKRLGVVLEEKVVLLSLITNNSILNIEENILNGSPMTYSWKESLYELKLW
jgi:hypothetical protein